MSVSLNFAVPPLVRADALALGCGHVRWSGRIGAGKVYAAIQAHLDAPSVWEGGILLAALLKDRPLEEDVCRRALAEAEKQRDDGSWDLPAADALALARSCLTMYELSGDLALIRRVGAWLAWFAGREEDLLSEGGLAERLADVWELLERYYRLTGKKGVLKLCERLRADGMDWTTALHTFSLQQGMAAEMSFAEMKTGMASVDEKEAERCRRMSAVGHAETLADGLRAALCIGRYSGNAMELSAAKAGWEKATRWHGAVCGGTTADEWLAGRAPGRVIAPAACGAWTEALSACATEPERDWAIEALERLVFNALPVAADGPQQANQPTGIPDTEDCYAMIADEAHSLGRLARGWAALAAAAVMHQPDGALIALPLPGMYRLSLGGQAALLSLRRIADSAFSYAATLRLKAEAEATVRLRIPAWAERAEVRVADEPPQLAEPGAVFTLRRRWQEETQMRVRLMPALRMERGYHQSVSVYDGPALLCMPVDERGWKVAAAGQPERVDGQVLLPVKPVREWRVPGDVPVFPQTEGEKRMVRLEPYTDCNERLSVFPREYQA